MRFRLLKLDKISSTALVEKAPNRRWPLSQALSLSLIWILLNSFLPLLPLLTSLELVICILFLIIFDWPFLDTFGVAGAAHVHWLLLGLLKHGLAASFPLRLLLVNADHHVLIVIAGLVDLVPISNGLIASFEPFFQHFYFDLHLKDLVDKGAITRQLVPLDFFIDVP